MTDTNVQRSIDSIDLQILQLAETRQHLVEQLTGSLEQGSIGQVAAAAAEIKKVVQSRPPCDALSRQAQTQLLKCLSGACLESVRAMRVAFLGPKYSYSHLAATKYFGEAVSLTPVGSIPAVFDAVARGDMVAGLVPIENSTDGRVVDTLGMFIRQDMEICGEVLLPIHHNLLARTTREKITEVHSKPQALSQCRNWLASQLPQAKVVENSSTAAAAKLASEKTGVAAVASIEAGRAYNLDVIDQNIEDNPNNVTRFAVLGKERPSPTEDDKTALLFQVSHCPGALADAMTIFKQSGLNLTWIESFPAPETKNEYLFFIELSGHRDDPPVQTAIDELTASAQRLDILGSYPRAVLT
ncbi:MAG: prephenate dehydratase [Planctomycetota bacterium]|nr:prephenate dehydratase [Planctomycetota bacterium]